jgi:hypothetical protein
MARAPTGPGLINMRLEAYPAPGSRELCGRSSDVMRPRGVAQVVFINRGAAALRRCAGSSGWLRSIGIYFMQNQYISG